MEACEEGHLLLNGRVGGPRALVDRVADSPSLHPPPRPPALTGPAWLCPHQPWPGYPTRYVELHTAKQDGGVELRHEEGRGGGG